MAEAGVPGYEVYEWNAVFAPAGTPAAVVAKLSDAIAKATQSQDFRDRVSSLGGEPTGYGPGEAQRFVRAQTGRPFNVTSGTDRANVGRTYQRPNVSGNPNNGPKTPDEWFSRSVFSLPQPFSYGNAGAFIVEGDGIFTVDTSLGKKFKFAEKHSVEFRGEFFNMFNTTRLGGPNTNLSSSAFGQITGTNQGNRQIQLALRYSF